jgi:hypothetical protein
LSNNFFGHGEESATNSIDELDYYASEPKSALFGKKQ